MMTKSEIAYKIQALVDSGEGENSYIAIYMMINELGLTLEEALKSLKPISYERSVSTNNSFYSSIRIANIWVEYDYEEGYVPYMGTESTVSRMVGYWQKDKMEYEVDLSRFLPTEDSTSVEEVKQLILEDYYSLIPVIIDLLERV